MWKLFSLNYETHITYFAIKNPNMQLQQPPQKKTRCHWLDKTNLQIYLKNRQSLSLTKHPRNKFGVEKFSPSKKHPTKSQCTKKNTQVQKFYIFLPTKLAEFFFPGIFPKHKKGATSRFSLEFWVPIFFGKKHPENPWRVTGRSEAGWLLCGDAVVKVRKGGPKEPWSHGGFFSFKMDGV